MGRYDATLSQPLRGVPIRVSAIHVLDVHKIVGIALRDFHLKKQTKKVR